jgi:hypothetical protein
MAPKLYIGLTIFLVFSCFQKRYYLTEDEKKLNPYNKGQTVIFESNKDEKDSVFISDVRFQFPDGIGVINYDESVLVVARYFDPLQKVYRGTYWITINAGTPDKPSNISFGLEVKDAKFYDEDGFFIRTILAIPDTTITVPFGTFTDVIEIKSRRDYSNVPYAITQLYWSKSLGYIRFDKYDGTIWELKDIINPK